MIDSLHALQLQSNPTLVAADESWIGLGRVLGKDVLGVFGRVNINAPDSGIIVVAAGANSTEYTCYE